MDSLLFFRTFEAIRRFLSQAKVDFWDKEQHYQNIRDTASSIMKACTPNRAQFRDQKFVLLFKYFAARTISTVRENNYENYGYLISQFKDKMEKFAMNALDNGNQIEEYADHLTSVFNSFKF